MLAIDKILCHFIVHTLFPDIKVIGVPFDKIFVDDMLAKLNDLYENYFKPAFLRRLFLKDSC